MGMDDDRLLILVDEVNLHAVLVILTAHVAHVIAVHYHLLLGLKHERILIRNIAFVEN